MLPQWLNDPICRLTGRWAVHVVGDQIDDVSRARFEAAMTLARDRMDAADVLGRAPLRAESIHVLLRGVQALEEAVACVDQAVPSEGRPPGFAPEVLVQTLKTLRDGFLTVPPIDADLSPEDLSHREEARRTAGHVHSYLRRVTRRRRAVISGRWAAASVGLILIVVAWLGISRLQDRLEIVASGIYSPVFDAERAADGDPSREWLAPEGASAWLELRFAQPIDVKGVRVTNAHNPGFNDRATRDLDVELYRKEQLLTRAHYTFDQVEVTPAARTIPVEAQGVTRVRFVARTFHGRGAGLAEVEVVEGKR
jgi:hypothetical protein